MENGLQWYLALIAIFISSLSAGFVAAYLAKVSVSSPLRKRIFSVEQDLTALVSEFGNLQNLTKKISQRVALDQYRHRRGKKGDPTDEVDETPTIPAPGDKRAAKAFYLTGRTHQDVARLVMKGTKTDES